MKSKIYSITLALAIVLVAHVASAQSNLVKLVSQPGDYIGQGQTYETTNRGSFTISTTPSKITVTAFGFNIVFAGPGGAALTVGSYTNAARYPFNGSSPGLNIDGNGRGCNTVCGVFQISELHTDGSGNVDRFRATFKQICECSNPPMTGEIRFDAAFPPPSVPPRTLRVPRDYTTIQAAINNASSTVIDTVLVAPGTYYENVVINAKAVTVVSENGPQLTIIDGRKTGAVFTLSTSGGLNSMIKGFTIQNGNANSGAGITLQGASPAIVSNIFQNNSGQSAGIRGDGVSPIIVQNLFRNNSADDQALSGVLSFVNNSSPLIANNVFVRNPCRAINLTLPSRNNPVVINNTFVSNNVGIRVDARVSTSSHTYCNNIFVGNTIGLQVEFGSSSTYPLWVYNLVTGGQNYSGIPDQTGKNGNISAAPRFACLPGQDYHLLTGSPCIDAGTNEAPRLPDGDFEDEARILSGTVGGTPTVDLGAFEFNPANPPPPRLSILCPSNMIVTAAAGSNGTRVTFNISATSACDPNFSIICQPPSGAFFPLGTTTVQCLAVDTSGNSNTCSFAVRVNARPEVAIIAPANPAIYVVPQPILLLASASDPDGDGVTSVDYYAGTNWLGAASGGGVLAWSNAPPGIYQIVAVATDSLGAKGQSSVVVITNLAQPPMSSSAISTTNGLNFNQRGLFTQIITVTNPTPVGFAAVRLLVQLDVASVAIGTRVWNATSTNVSGVPYLQSNLPLPAGQRRDFTVEYYIPDRRTVPAPTFTIEVVPAEADLNPTGTALEIDRVLPLADGSVLVEFSTLTNRLYYLQYSADMLAWKTALPAVTGTGSRVQWFDNGPPKTESVPNTQTNRFYRILMLP